MSDYLGETRAVGEEPIPPKIEIACILLNYRIPEDTLECLQSFLDTGFTGFKFFVINNYVQDGSRKPLTEFLAGSGMPFRYLEPGENLGYTGGVNLGIKAAFAEDVPHIMLLNNDAVVCAGFAEAALQGIRAYPDQVKAGWVLDYTTGQPSTNSGRITCWIYDIRRIMDPTDAAPFDFVSGCLILVPSWVYRKVGLLDDRYFMYREDLDFSLRLRAAGIRLRHIPGMVIRHKVSSATDRSGTPKEYYRIRNQTHIILARSDPFRRLIYLVFLFFLLLYKVRHPGMFAVFVRGIWDAFRGKLGKI